MKAGARLIALVAVVVLAAACAKKDQPSGPARTGFNHRVHVEAAGLECSMCHETAESSASAGMPALETCQACHGEDPDKTRPFTRDGQPAWSSFAAVADEVKFSHQAHVGKGLKCGDCHGEMARSELTGKELAFTMDACTDCHARREVKDDCATCHTRTGKDVAPQSHQRNWKRYHGPAARARLHDPVENRCSLCHSEQTCASCHRVEEPSSHTGMWNTRGHGIAARMDRSTCATCHQSDTCDSCHRETTPVSHRGGWGSPRDNHCVVCHFPAQNESCFSCHKQMTGHLAAPGLPGGTTHATASEYGCRNCHQPGLSHPDNGDSCRNCHRQ